MRKVKIGIQRKVNEGDGEWGVGGLEKRNIMGLVWESYKQQILWLKLT